MKVRIDEKGRVTIPKAIAIMCNLNLPMDADLFVDTNKRYMKISFDDTERIKNAIKKRLSKSIPNSEKTFLLSLLDMEGEKYDKD